MKMKKNSIDSEEDIFTHTNGEKIELDVSNIAKRRISAAELIKRESNVSVDASFANAEEARMIKTSRQAEKNIENHDLPLTMKIKPEIFTDLQTKYILEPEPILNSMMRNNAKDISEIPVMKSQMLLDSPILPKKLEDFSIAPRKTEKEK